MGSLDVCFSAYLCNMTPQESCLRWPTQFPFLFGLLTLQASALHQKNTLAQVTPGSVSCICHHL